MRLNYLLLQLLEEVVALEVQLIAGLCPLVTLKYLKHIVLRESGPVREHHVDTFVMISLSLLCDYFSIIKMWREMGFLQLRRN